MPGTHAEKPDATRPGGRRAYAGGRSGVVSGPLESLPDEHRRRLREAPPGADLAASPMLATLSDRRNFGDGGWIFERKLDGIRVLAVRKGDSMQLLSRTGRPLNGTFPEIADALANLAELSPALSSLSTTNTREHLSKKQPQC